MCPSLCALAAGLIVGQVQDVTTFNAEPVQPACKHCAASTNTGWTQVQTSTQTRTWSQTGVWTPTTGWTWHNSSEVSAEDRPLLSRVSERLNGLFGNRQDTPGDKARGQTSGRQSTGWHEEDAQPFSGLSTVPVISSDHPQRLAVGRVTTNEPPLLEVAARPEAAAIKTTSFEPALVVSAADASGKIRPALLSKIGHAEDYSWLIGQVEVANGAHLVHYAAPTSHDRFGGHMILNGDVDLSRFQSGDLVTVHGGVIPGQTGSLYRVQSVDLINRAGK